MNYEETIVINNYQNTLFGEILAITEGDCKDYGHSEVIHVETAIFSDGCMADIKLCNGETPYVDYVLFDKKGHELTFLEISDEFTGEFVFEFEDNTYTVNVIVEGGTL